MISIELWKPADGLILETNALKVILEVARSVAMTAGPGSGKTEMLAQRCDFLLRTGVCPYPRRILAISAKVDASTNLAARVRTRCGPDLARRLDSYTFHAFAKRLIDRFRPLLTGSDALDPDYSIGVIRVPRRQIRFEDMVPWLRKSFVVVQWRGMRYNRRTVTCSWMSFRIALAGNMS